MERDTNFGSRKSKFNRQYHASNVSDLIQRYNEQSLDNGASKQFDPNSENKMDNNNGNLSKSQTDLTAGLGSRQGEYGLSYVMKPWIRDQSRSNQNPIDSQSQNSYVDSDEKDILPPPPLPPPPLCRQKKPIPVKDNDARNLEDCKDFVDDLPLPPHSSELPPPIPKKPKVPFKNQSLHSPTRPSFPPPPVPISLPHQLNKKNQDNVGGKMETPSLVQVQKNHNFLETKSMRSHEKPSTSDEGEDSDDTFYSTPESVENSKWQSWTFWSELPEVSQSSLLRSLDSHQLKFQEAKFEILSSEASYLKSLNILIDHFYTKIKDAQILKKNEIAILFGVAEDVRDCSKKLLWDLERCLQNSVLLNNLTDIIQKNVDDNFHTYISYCKNQMLIEELLQRLKKNDNFMKLVEQLEADPVCQSLSLSSFIMLPMQRITRWPLLIDAILKNFNSPNHNSDGDTEFKDFQKILINLNRLVVECNENAKKLEQKRELMKIIQKLQFDKKVPVINLLASDRSLVKCGELQAKTNKKTDNIGFSVGTPSKKTNKVELYLFLFNDLLLVTKQKNDMFRIIHYCERDLLVIEQESPIIDKNEKHLINLTLSENQDKKIIPLSLQCKNESDKERWLVVLKESKVVSGSEIVYAQWDCPQVIATHNYLPRELDEMKLSVGEIIKISKKLTDGWYYGQKLSNGQLGWFPSNCIVELNDRHVIAEHIKQPHRLLTAIANANS